jgi:hypothetical protein
MLTWMIHNNLDVVGVGVVSLTTHATNEKISNHRSILPIIRSRSGRNNDNIPKTYLHKIPKGLAS